MLYNLRCCLCVREKQRNRCVNATLLCTCTNAGNITKEAGPVSMTFTIPMFNSSRLQVRFFLDLVRT